MTLFNYFVGNIRSPSLQHSTGTSAIDCRCYLRAFLAFWLVEARGLLSLRITKGLN